MHETVLPRTGGGFAEPAADAVDAALVVPETAAERAWCQTEQRAGRLQALGTLHGRPSYLRIALPRDAGARLG